jgi:ATP-dependent protease HslVU (ClpYQ) peptidase subunit
LQSPCAHRKHSPRRLRWLIAGTALIIAAIAAANGLILAKLHRTTLREVQDNLLRQSLDLSELTEHALQAADLVLISVADEVSTIAVTADDAKALEGKDLLSERSRACRSCPRLASSTVTSTG